MLAWGVAQRIGEIGVRMALGARAADIGRMILGQGGRLIAIGFVLGALGAVALGRVLSARLFGVDSFDPAVLAITLLGLGAAAFCRELPPQRAARLGAHRSRCASVAGGMRDEPGVRLLRVVSPKRASVRARFLRNDDF